MIVEMEWLVASGGSQLNHDFLKTVEIWDCVEVLGVRFIRDVFELLDVVQCVQKFWSGSEIWSFLRFLE